MKKGNIYQLFLEYLKNENEDNSSLMMLNNEQDEKETRELIQLHKNINQIPTPEPSDIMKERFYKKLKSIEDNTLSNESITTGKSFFIHHFRKSDFLKIAATITLFVLGYIAGILTNKQSKETSALLTELQQTQETLVLTLLDQPSATDRLKAVNISFRIKSHDQKIINALLITLNNDPNINVRLSTIDALIAMADNPQVRIGLIQSINHQESPLIQNALADAMVFLNEKRSVEQLKLLLDRNNLDKHVRQKVTESIHSLTKI